MVNIISVVSLVSLLIPVAAVIVLLSVFNGFGSLVGDLNRAVDSDLTIMLREGRMFGEGDVDCAELREIDGVEAVSLVTEQMMLVEYRDQSRLLTFRGVDEDYVDAVPIETMVSVGRFEVELGDLERVVLGSSVASGLGIRSLYDTDLRLYALRSGGLQSLLPMAGRVEQSVAQLAGVVMMDQEAEERYGYASRRLINRLSGSEGRALRVVIKLAKGADKERVRGAVERGVAEQFKVLSREELNPALYDIIKYEKLGVLLICSLVMLLASFSLVGALSMLIIEKRGDMGRLRAMGATRGELRQIFIIEGGLISGVAILGGVVLGSIASLAQQWFGFVKMPQGSMLGANYPVDLQVVDLLTVAVIASVIALVLSQLVVRKMFSSYYSFNCDTL